MKSLDPTSVAELLRRPLRLAINNFTPLTRTPWAGSAISTMLKDQLLPDQVGLHVGESWEFSADPNFPSLVLDSPLGLTLEDVSRLDPLAFFGRDTDHLTIELLVKLLNAKVPLSIQLHPSDDDKDALGPMECGKPESWLILHHEPGAGIYFGFNDGVDHAALRGRLSSGKSIEDLLQFVPVSEGDYFEVDPHVVHAIGAGVLLCEPQRVLPGKAGKTLRLWDWERRYDANGLPSEFGEPRALHVELALKLLDSNNPQGKELLAAARKTPRIIESHGQRHFDYKPNAFYKMDYINLDSSGHCRISDCSSYAALLVVGGAVLIDGTSLRLPKGQTAVCPQASFPLTLRSDVNGTRLLVVTPAHAKPAIRLA